MDTQKQSLATRTKESETGNGWEKLLPLLDPAVANAPQAKNAWKKLIRKQVVYLTNTVAKFPWLNHLALAIAIYEESGAAHTMGAAVCLHSFLRWAIPAHYPDVSALKPVEALIGYFGDPPNTRGHSACHAYGSLQLHVRDYLQVLPPEERTPLTPFLFPLLVETPQLVHLKVQTTRQGQAKRKEQAFAVVRDLQGLVAMGRRRYKWLADLDAQLQRIKGSVANQEIALPVILRCQDPDHQQVVTFRVWDRNSWILHHRQAYSPTAPQRLTATEDGRFFLQLASPLPESPWFLRAAQIGGLTSIGHRRKPNLQARKYYQDCRIRPFAHVAKGLIHPDTSLALTLAHARAAAAGTPEDSRVLFCVEPLLTAAAVGLFALVCLTQSGMRIGELLQVSGDKACMKIGFFPTFNERADSFAENATKLFFWQLYPKGSSEREPYPVTPYMQEALKVWMEMHGRFCGHFQEASPHADFSHARRFVGKHKFVMQWNGQHLSARGVESCLDLLLLEHFCLDSQGKPTRITAHVLRHGVAGYLHQQGIPLEDIASLLHQVNVMVTEYYSRLSPQDLFAKLGPLLTRLGDVAEVDPATLRTVGDLKTLGQEALKRFGVLRRIPGGTCAVFTACEVQFKCASCPSYIPNPLRRDEVIEQITGCAKTAQFLEQSGDFLQAQVQRAHAYRWKRIEKEMQALASIELASPPYESTLKEFGLVNLDAVDNDWLLTLKQQPQLSSGGNPPHD